MLANGPQAEKPAPVPVIAAMRLQMGRVSDGEIPAGDSALDRRPGSRSAVMKAAPMRLYITW